MKYIDIHHPVFSPFHKLTMVDCENLILAKSKDFNKTEKKGELIQDYSVFFEKWNELNNYVLGNKEWIYKEGDFNGFTIGEVTLRLIAAWWNKLES
jgi:hypothetical protein